MGNAESFFGLVALVLIVVMVYLAIFVLPTSRQSSLPTGQPITEPYHAFCQTVSDCVNSFCPSNATLDCRLNGLPQKECTCVMNLQTTGA